jgi:hypothetical protein
MFRNLFAAAITLGVSLTATSSFALTVETSATQEQMVETILGTGITFSNVVLTGANGSLGTFSDGGTSIGIDSGILLTSGSAAEAVGPNDNTAQTTANGTPGDVDLDGLIPGFTTFDATTLSFDFTTDTGNVFFNYVFASEEYNEWVGSAFNDVFGFFVDGVNIALLPGTTTPVSINNVNLGSNPGSYVNNEGGTVDTQYDGLTTVLTAVITGLTAGAHTIKLAIADAGDSSLDSGVFIQAGSFSSTPTDVPELDARSGASALALLLFAGLLLSSSRRRELALA